MRTENSKGHLLYEMLTAIHSKEVRFSPPSHGHHGMMGRFCTLDCRAIVVGANHVHEQHHP